MSDRDRIYSEVVAAIETVEDPCSVFNGTHLSLPDLGMVDRVDVEEDGRVLVRLFLDDPTCIFFFEITRLIKDALAPIAGIVNVEFDIKADEIWTEERMRPHAREQLEAMRTARRELPMASVAMPPAARRPTRTAPAPAPPRPAHALPMVGAAR